MKKLALLTSFIITTGSLTACGNQSLPILDTSLQNSAISTFSNNASPKNVSKLSEITFPESDFSKIAERKSTKDYATTDEIFKSSTKNGIFDRITKSFPFKDYDKFHQHILKEFKADYTILTFDVNSDYHSHMRRMYNKNLNAYYHAQSIYKASTFDMKRFISLDMLVNGLSSRETHNPPFRPGFKLLPTKAAKIMPTFAEISEFNKKGKGVPYVEWNPTNARQFYESNYARYMGMIMEYGPTERKAYDLIHKEISNYAGR